MVNGKQKKPLHHGVRVRMWAGERSLVYNNTLGKGIEVYSWFITLFGRHHLSPGRPADSGLLQNGNGVSTWGIPLLVWEQGAVRKVRSIVQLLVFWRNLSYIALTERCYLSLEVCTTFICSYDIYFL